MKHIAGNIYSHGFRRVLIVKKKGGKFITKEWGVNMGQNVLTRSKKELNMMQFICNIK